MDQTMDTKTSLTDEQHDINYRGSQRDADRDALNAIKKLNEANEATINFAETFKKYKNAKESAINAGVDVNLAPKNAAAFHVNRETQVAESGIKEELVRYHGLDVELRALTGDEKKTGSWVEKLVKELLEEPKAKIPQR